MKILDEAQLTFLELDTKYFAEKPTDREGITALIEEVRHWRTLGESPAAVEEVIEELRYDLDTAREEVRDLQRNAMRSVERD